MSSKPTPPPRAPLPRSSAALEEEVERLRKQVSKLTREKESYESLARHIPDLLARFDRELRHVYVNPATQEATGRSAEEFLGRTNDELGMPPALCSRWREAQLAVLSTGEPRTLEFEFPEAGETRVFQSHIVPEFDEVGEIASLLGVTREVTAARRAEEELRRSQQELRDFFENATVGLHWVGPDGTILWANPYELEMLGYSPEEYVGRNISEFHADAEVIDDILDRLGAGEELHQREARLRCRDGSIRHVRISSNVLFEEGRFVHTRCFTTDVTAQKRADAERDRLIEALDVANRAKAHFLATMSHEFRTPLNAIIGYTELLAEGIAQPLNEQSRAYVNRVALSARHLIQLIDGILDVSRLESGRETISQEPVALGDLIDEVTAIAEPLASVKGIEFRTSRPREGIRFLTDPRKVRQILLNLVGNAIKFTERGGVAFRVELEKREIRFEVEDTGVGMAAEDVERAFEPFWQGGEATGGGAGGAGLGLSIAQEFTRLLGGQLTVQSEPGTGSHFTLRLPFLPAPDAHDSPDAAADPDSSSRSP